METLTIKNTKSTINTESINNKTVIASITDKMNHLVEVYYTKHEFSGVESISYSVFGFGSKMRNWNKFKKLSSTKNAIKELNKYLESEFKGLGTISFN